MSPRLTRWIRAAFAPGTAEPVLDVLRDLPPGVVGGQDPERVQAALVLGAQGDWTAFSEQLTLAELDWRDALVAAGLGNEDWPKRLDDVLGSD